MTMIHVQKRLAAIEKELSELRATLEYQRAVEGIRRGLESADRGEGAPARQVFNQLRRKHGLAQRQ
jgi:hypothetical protein